MTIPRLTHSTMKGTDDAPLMSVWSTSKKAIVSRRMISKDNRYLALEQALAKHESPREVPAHAEAEPAVSPRRRVVVRSSMEVPTQRLAEVRRRVSKAYSRLWGLVDDDLDGIAPEGPAVRDDIIEALDRHERGAPVHVVVGEFAARYEILEQLDIRVVGPQLDPATLVGHGTTVLR